MALTTLEFFIRDFTDTGIHGSAEVYFHPVQMSTRGSGWRAVFVDRPIKAGPPEAGLYTVELEDRHSYRMEVLWQDGDRSRVGRSEWFSPFPVPTSNETINLSALLGLPPRNGMVRVTTSDPTSSLFDQYVYNSSTGDLYERTA